MWKIVEQLVQKLKSSTGSAFEQFGSPNKFPYDGASDPLDISTGGRSSRPRSFFKKV
jgi:hypothetical protein